MDLKDIVYTLQDMAKRVVFLLGEIPKLPKAKLYILLACILTILFMILTFPYEIVIRNQLQKLEPQMGSNISVGTIDFSFLDDIVIESLAIAARDGAELNLRNISLDMSLNPFTYFFNNTYRGTLAVKEVNYVRKNISISGTVNSSFDIETDTVSGTLNLTLQNVIMNGLAIKGFDIPPLRFTSITADTRIVNREFTLTRTVLSGMDLRGEIGGRITLSKPLRNSRLNLTFEIDKNSRILNDYKILIGNLVGDDENLRINITGLLSKPEVNLPERIPVQVEDEEEKEKPAVTREMVPALRRE